jgi:hypothetical protein
MRVMHSINRERKKEAKKEREAATTALSYFSQKLVLTTGSPLNINRLVLRKIT